MSLSVEIKLNRVYHEGDTLRGIVSVINSGGSDAKYDAITVVLDGNVTLQFGNRNAAFEAFTSSAKTLPLIYNSATIAPAGYFTSGLTEFPFEFPLHAQRDASVLYETYHGVFVVINYAVRCEVRRPFLAKSLTKSVTFVMQNRAPPAPDATAASTGSAASAAVVSRRGSGGGGGEVNFTISPESMAKTAKERIAIPRFLITGRLDRSEWCVTKPITGNLTVQHTEVKIKSIECQLIRVETSCADGTPSDATEIQNIQIADGNVCAKLQIPIYMVLPRLFVCPAVKSKSFKVDFEMNLVIAFQDNNYCVTENFKLPLNRFASTA